jgi:hypothetical protein
VHALGGVHVGATRDATIRHQDGCGDAMMVGNVDGLLAPFTTIVGVWTSAVAWFSRGSASGASGLQDCQCPCRREGQEGKFRGQRLSKDGQRPVRVGAPAAPVPASKGRGCSVMGGVVVFVRPNAKLPLASCTRLAESMWVQKAPIRLVMQ